MAWCLALGMLSCDGQGTEPPPIDVGSVRFVAGADQVDLPGASLAAPLVVEVRSTGGDRTPGVVVRFDVSEGVGLRLDAAEALTDAEGRAQTRVRLGPESGSYRVRATVAGTQASAEVIVYGAAVPVLSSAPADARAGEVVALEGVDLWSALGGWVTFSGIRARVVTATSSRLQVEVPACLPNQTVQVRVGGPTGTSMGALVRVVQDASPGRLALGEAVRLTGPEPGECLRVGLDAGDEVLLLLSSATAQVGAARSYAVSAVSQLPAQPAVGQGADRPVQVGMASSPGVPGGVRLRSWRHAAPPAHRVAGPLTTGVGASPTSGLVPGVGDVRQFQVLQPDGRFRTVTADVRHVSRHAAFFVESALTTPEQGDVALADLGALFDGSIWEVGTGFFGTPSDLDGDGRVAVLMTSVVNTFEGQGGEGRVGGFFFPGDLTPGQTGSNGGEVLYVIAPDSAGSFGEPIASGEVFAGLPGVLVHELQHLIHYNERVLSGRAPQAEATWLSEALAMMAEDRLASALADQGASALADRVARGNYTRAADFLSAPSNTSLIIQLGTGTLAERGAGWLFLRYLTDRYGEPLLGALTRGTLRGIENVEDQTGLTWAQLLSDWGVALWADDLPGIDATFQYPTLDLRGAVGAGPTALQSLLGEFETVSGTLPPSSVAHLVLRGESLEDVGLGLADGGGTGRIPSAEVTLTAVRIR